MNRFATVLFVLASLALSATFSEASSTDAHAHAVKAAHAAKAAADAAHVASAFALFKLQHNKNYHPDHEDYYMRVFAENLAKIEAHNRLFEQGLVSWKMGVNKFADMSDLHFKSLYHPRKIQRNQTLIQNQKKSDNDCFFSCEDCGK
jgi:hypothetical protein